MSTRTISKFLEVFLLSQVFLSELKVDEVTRANCCAAQSKGEHQAACRGFVNHSREGSKGLFAIKLLGSRVKTSV